MWQSVLVLAMACTTATGKTSVWVLNKRVGDKKLDRNARCGAVFELFEKHLAPGATPSKARGVLTERSWIVVDNPVRVVGGSIPVELNFKDSVFVVHCLAKPEPKLDNALWSDWVIYGRVSGDTVSTLGEFLAAKTDTVKLLEYALMRPDASIVHKP
jgi:hypothetical protein